MSVIDGADFGSGFLSGMISSVISSGTQPLKIKSVDLRNAITIASGGLSGGISSSIAGGNFWAGVRQGLITSGLNHVAHVVKTFIQKTNTLVVGILGAGGNTVGNSDFTKFIEKKGGKIFTSSQPDGSTRFGNDGDNKIMDYIKQNSNSNTKVELYGYSRGGAAVIRIVNKMSSFSFSRIILFDPHSLNAGLFPHEITNRHSKSIITFWQKKMISVSNPFTGSPVYSNYTFIQNIDLTNKNVNHNTIVQFALSNYTHMFP